MNNLSDMSTAELQAMADTIEGNFGETGRNSSYYKRNALVLKAILIELAKR